jgi:hypothetical protein
MKNEMVNRPSVVNANIAQCVNQNINGEQSFTLSELSCEFA